MGLSRRDFLGTTGAAVLTAGAMTRGRVFGANDRVRVASVGIRGRGGGHMNALFDRDDCEVAAICDVDQKVLDGRLATIKQNYGYAPKTYADMRELFADDSIDAVTFATPNHWHVLGAIWAMEAGKDVYVEKPISHTVWEGRQLVAAQKKYNRVLQHGTQRRSEPPWQRMVERAKAGIIGDIYMAEINVTRFREPFNYPKSEPVPEGLDWTLWQGPAPERPFSRNYVHYNWHWFWHYGNGEIANNGVHRTDVVNWVWDKGLPVKTYSSGGIFGYDVDARETPNTQSVCHTFADGTLLNMHIWNRYTEGRPFLMMWGTEGYLDGTTFYGKDGKAIPDDKEVGGVDNSTAAHMEDWIDAVKKGDPSAVVTTAEQGHVAAAFCHLGNISYRLGREIRFDPKTEQCPGDEEANELLTREYRKGFEVPALA